MAAETDPRKIRRWQQEPIHGDLAASPFRADRDRVASSPFFGRLAGVTQVVSPSGSGLLLHNRLTHSLKVAQIARAVAERLISDPDSDALLEKLGGCDPDVVEAAALAHDLGHPPFGHLGEEILDRIARNRFNLLDGFEGNAQSFRIVTTTDARGPARCRARPHRRRARGAAEVPVDKDRLPAAASAHAGRAAARRDRAAGRRGHRVAQVLRLRHGTHRPGPGAGRVRGADRAVAADRRGVRDGHRRRHRVRHS